MSTEDCPLAELRHIRMITPVDASLPEFLFCRCSSVARAAAL